MVRVWWRVKQKSIGSVSPHAWQLPVLLNLWLTVIATALAIAVHKRTDNGTCEFQIPLKGVASERELAAIMVNHMFL